MSVKINLLKNAGANLWNKASNIILKLIQVPILLSTLTVEDFGRWLVITSIPSWLIISNLGFGNVASNEIIISSAKGDLEKARNQYSTAIVFIGLIGIVGICLISLLLFIFPVETFLDLPPIKHKEISISIFLLSLSLFISFFQELFIAKFRAARKAHLSVLITSLLPWLELIALVITLKFTNRFDFIALGLLLATIIHTIIIYVASSKIMPLVYFSKNKINLGEHIYLFKKGIAFLAFPLGNAFLFQGNLLIIQYFLGPASVALYGTIRTLIRTVNHSLDLINQATWPEFTYLFGLQDLVKIRKLHRAIVGISILTSILGIIFLAIFGEHLYRAWVGESITISKTLLLVFLLPIPFHAIWFTSSVVHIACNMHEGLAIRYLVASLFSLITCLILTKEYSLIGAAGSTLFVEILLIPYVLKKSLQISNDSLSSFIKEMIKETKQLHKHLNVSRKIR